MNHESMCSEYLYRESISHLMEAPGNEEQQYFCRRMLEEVVEHLRGVSEDWWRDQTWKTLLSTHIYICKESLSKEVNVLNF